MGCDLNQIDWVEEKRVLRTMLEKAQAKVAAMENNRFNFGLEKLKVDEDVVKGALIGLVLGEAGADAASKLDADGQTAYRLATEFRPVVLGWIWKVVIKAILRGLGGK